MLHVGRLRALREVAARGSFSEAADALSYTQSAVSQAVATLEAEVGEKLGAGMRRFELLEDPMRLALPSGHPFASKAKVGLGDLSGEAWVQTSARSPCARHVVRSCHTAGFEPNVAFESDDYLTVQGLVAAGVGVALIPELALSIVREDIVIRALSPSPPSREVIAAVPERARLVPAAPAMLAVLEQAAARYANKRGRPA